MAKKGAMAVLEKELNNKLAYNPLMATLKENDKKNLFVTNVTTAFLKTGFPLFDYFFGSVVNIHNEIGQIVQQLPRLGQACGVINHLIGMSSSGKTSLAIQLAANLIRPYKNGQILHFDCEQRMDISRIENLSQLPIQDFRDGGRYILRSGMVGMDIIQGMIMDLYASKTKIKDEITVTTDSLDEFGKPIQILEPTVIIIDSVKSLLGETFSVDNAKELADAAKLASNTEGARVAKGIGGFLKDILAPCKEANIIVYLVNHVNSNMSMNAYLPPAKQQLNLKIDESIPGGRAVIFYPFNIIKLIPRGSDDFTPESDGFRGHMVTFEPIKSSSNQSGNSNKGVSFDMVFTSKRGFDSTRSLILYGKDKGLLEGTKARLKFIGDPSFTFSFKELDMEMIEKPIWECIKKYIIPSLEEHLSYVEPMPYDVRLMDY